MPDISPSGFGPANDRKRLMLVNFSIAMAKSLSQGDTWNLFLECLSTIQSSIFLPTYQLNAIFNFAEGMVDKWRIEYCKEHVNMLNDLSGYSKGNIQTLTLCPTRYVEAIQASLTGSAAASSVLIVESAWRSF